MRCDNRIEMCGGQVVLYCKLKTGHIGKCEPPEYLAEHYRRIELRCASSHDKMLTPKQGEK